MSTTAPIHRTAWARTLLLSLGAAVAVGVILLAFIWPTMTSSVKNLPIAVSGTAQQTSQVTKQLESRSPGTFAVTRVSTRADAVRLIRTRDVDGAVIVQASPEVLTASANGAAVTQIMSGVATATHATVTDIVPLSSQDSRGLGLSAASFPLALGGILGGILIALTVTGSWRRLVGVGVYAVLAGVGVTALLQGLFGILLGGFWLNAAAISLTMAATASFVVGMNALVGRVGIPVGSVVTMLVGNPLSASTQPAQFGGVVGCRRAVVRAGRVDDAGARPVVLPRREPDVRVARAGRVGGDRAGGDRGRALPQPAGRPPRVRRRHRRGAGAGAPRPRRPARAAHAARPEHALR